MAWPYRRRFNRFGGGYRGGGYRPRYRPGGYTRYRRWSGWGAKPAPKPITPGRAYYNRRRTFLNNAIKHIKGRMGPYTATQDQVDFTNSAPGTYEFSGVGDYQFSKRVKPSFGARAGAWLGDRAQAWLGRITGLGDYTVNSNSMMGTDPPRVSNGANLREIIISHREYIGDIVTGAAGTFNKESFLLNPGNARIFPWLSAVATCFQQYKFRGVVFEFKSMSADALNSTNTALGNVIMASNYNVLQPDFASKSEMENTEFSSSCKPSASMYHPIECDPRDTPLSELYIAPNGVIPDGGTPQFYDFCNFQIATNGFQAANVNIGELWVTYEVALLKPIQPSIAGIAPLMHFYERSAAPKAIGGGVSIQGGAVSTNLPDQDNIALLFNPPVRTLPVVVSVIPDGLNTYRRRYDLQSIYGEVPVGTVLLLNFIAHCTGVTTGDFLTPPAISYNNMQNVGAELPNSNGVVQSTSYVKQTTGAVRSASYQVTCRTTAADAWFEVARWSADIQAPIGSIVTGYMSITALAPHLADLTV